MFNKLSVSKYYTDCIDEKGNVFIGYIGVVTWHMFHLDYANYLFYDASKDKMQSDYSVNKRAFPEWAPPQLRWRHEDLAIVGEWQSVHEPIEKTLFEDPESSMKWMCQQPLSAARVRVDKVILDGLGYTERLDLEINPLNLPFDTIRWGRFNAPDTSWVWIEWQGKFPQKFVYVNGEKYENVDISDDLVVVHDIEMALQLTEKLELRKGSLLDTVFKKLHWLTQFLPLKMLSAFECKWRSKGIVTHKKDSKEIVNGWAIHEIAIWK